MLEINGNIWQPETWKLKGRNLILLDNYQPNQIWLCITTNGIVKNNGRAVMGAGLAKEAVTKYPNIDLILGEKINKYGNKVHKLARLIKLKTTTYLYSFPTKNHYSEPSSLSLIKRSALQIVQLQQHSKQAGQNNIVVIPRPGCGLGRLDYSTQVKPLLENILIGTQFLIISRR